jgi:uncharacterized protein affecting Mg2+/Co2+ transport
MEIRELPGLGVKVDRVEYRPDVEAPKDRPYAFAYFITIRNESEETVTIKGRKWVATDSFAEGSYIGMTDGGDAVITRIPRFDMRVPG